MNTTQHLASLSGAIRALDAVLQNMGAGGLRGVLVPAGGRRVVEAVCGAEVHEMQATLAVGRRYGETTVVGVAVRDVGEAA